MMEKKVPYLGEEAASSSQPYLPKDDKRGWERVLSSPDFFSPSKSLVERMER